MPQHVDIGHHSQSVSFIYDISNVVQYLNISTVIETREMSLLCVLDLSAAFDTVNHDMLIDCLQHSFGVNGLALSWIESFFMGSNLFSQHQ